MRTDIKHPWGRCTHVRSDSQDSHYLRRLPRGFLSCHAQQPHYARHVFEYSAFIVLCISDNSLCPVSMCDVTVVNALRIRLIL